MDEYKIDFDLFTTEEVVKIYAFFSLIESTKKRKVPTKILLEKYREYQAIIKNKALEKKYDKMVKEATQVSIYETMKQARLK